MVCKRNIFDKTYGDKKEIKVTFTQFPNLGELMEACRESLGVAGDSKVSIAKYVPHAFEWRFMNPEEKIVEKQGKKKKTEVTISAMEFDLRKFPFLLTDGDIIGLRVDNEPGAETDDFQTETDVIAKEQFRVEQEKEKAEREKERTKGGKRHQEHNLVLNAGF